MALAISGTPRKARIEQLLSSIEGVITVRVALDREGDPVEIHVLSPPDLQAKQVVRNVISALTAGLGIHIDRRIISVAQLDPTVSKSDSPFAPAAEAMKKKQAQRRKKQAPKRDSEAPAPESDNEVAPSPESEPPPAAAPSPEKQPSHAAAPSPEKDPAPATESSPNTLREARPAELTAADKLAGAGRVVFSGYGTRQDESRHVTCSVSVRHNGREFTGTGQGPDTPYGRAEASARATLQALTAARSMDDIAFEGIALVETHGRTYVHIAAHAIDAREPTPLVGTAAIKRTTEEAAILATLQAANRRAERVSPGRN